MRIVFIGMVEFSQQCLREIIHSKADVVGIVTIDKSYAKFNSDYFDLAPLADKYDIPILKIKDIREKISFEFIRGLSPDIIFVLGFSQLIPKEILDLPPKGVIGSHPAALPKHRGRHPLIWSLIEGLEESALTFFYINEKADSGDILAQRYFSISLNDDAGTLYKKIIDLAKEMIRELLPQLEKGIVSRVTQDENLASYWRRRTERDSLIDWQRPTMEVYNLIRALTRPYPGADTFFSGKKFKIWKATIQNNINYKFSTDIIPGTILDKNDSLIRVKTRDSVLLLTDLDDGLRNIIEKGDMLGK